jgi:hypothetical protein
VLCRIPLGVKIPESKEWDCLLDCLSEGIGLSVGLWEVPTQLYFNVPRHEKDSEPQV